MPKGEAPPRPSPPPTSAPPGDADTATSDVRADVAFLEEYTWRWKNHLQMLEEVAQSNIDPDTVRRWRHQINACFRGKLTSRL